MRVGYIVKGFINSFLPVKGELGWILLACQKVSTLSSLVVGLENFMTTPIRREEHT